MLIMVVDDMTENLSLMDTLCQMDGFDTLLLPIADQVVPLAKEQQPDLIALDIYLHGERTGLHLLRELRNTPQTANLPVIAMSSGSHPDLGKWAFEAGADVFLHRPFRVKMWRKAVNQLLDDSYAHPLAIPPMNGNTPLNHTPN